MAEPDSSKWLPFYTPRNRRGEKLLSKRLIWTQILISFLFRLPKGFSVPRFRFASDGIVDRFQDAWSRVAHLPAEFGSSRTSEYIRHSGRPYWKI